MQLEFFKSQEAQGNVMPRPPSPPAVSKTLLETVALPEYFDTIRSDPELATGMAMSRSLWVSNPGYIPRDGIRQASVSHQDYIWDQDEIELMKAQGMLDKKHNLKRHEYSKYVEAAALMKYNIRGGGGGGGGASKK